ncbi:hypothetical protein [Rubritalea tangerina]
MRKRRSFPNGVGFTLTVLCHTRRTRALRHEGVHSHEYSRVSS